MPLIGEIAMFAFAGREESDSLVQELRTAGWIACEGQSVEQRSPNGLPDLFARIGTRWGTKDARNAFCLPDLRGRFVRGWNHGASADDVSGDPDAGRRQAVRPSGVTGDEVGSYQGDLFRRHAHGTKWQIARGHDDASSDWTPATSNAVQQWPPHGPIWEGGQETRPKNASVLFCIYAGSALPRRLPFFRSASDT